MLKHLRESFNFPVKSIMSTGTSTSVSSSKRLNSSKSDLIEGWTRNRGITKIEHWPRAHLKRWVLMKIISDALKETSISAQQTQVSPFKVSRARRYDKILTSMWRSALRYNLKKISPISFASLPKNHWI